MSGKLDTPALILGALVLPPLIGIAFVFGIPHRIGDTANQFAFVLFPVAILLLTILGAFKAKSPAARVAIVLIAFASTAVSWLVLAVGSMAG